MTSSDSANEDHAELERLIAELAGAEAYERRLRQYFVDIKAELAAGRTSTAMSMLNEALSYIDDAVDVVAPHRGE